MHQKLTSLVIDISWGQHLPVRYMAVPLRGRITQQVVQGAAEWRPSKVRDDDDDDPSVYPYTYLILA